MTYIIQTIERLYAVLITSGGWTPLEFVLVWLFEGLSSDGK